MLIRSSQKVFEFNRRAAEYAEGEGFSPCG